MSICDEEEEEEEEAEYSNDDDHCFIINSLLLFCFVGVVVAAAVTVVFLFFFFVLFDKIKWHPGHFPLTPNANSGRRPLLVLRASSVPGALAGLFRNELPKTSEGSRVHSNRAGCLLPCLLLPFCPHILKKGGEMRLI